MRVVSWNMGANAVRKEFHDGAWSYLLGSGGLDADIALVQEAIPPAWLTNQHELHWARAWPNSPGHVWGTGIVAKKGFGLAPVDRAVPDTRFVMARVRTDTAEFVVVSIHAHTSMAAANFSDGRVLRFVDRLQANFDAIGDDCRDRFIVGGDLNTGRVAETTWPGHGHAEFWARCDGAGFHSCPWSSSGEELTTYTHPSGGAFRGQADHVLVDSETARAATTFVPDMPAGLSDHFPLVVDLSWL